MSKATDRDQSRLFVPMSEDIEPWRFKPVARIVYGTPFELSVILLIVLNAFVLAALTYDALPVDLAEDLMAIDGVIIWFFVAELALRIISYGKKPWMFFKSGWNVFDFLIIALIPLFSNFTVVLRLLRLIRIVSIFRFIPEFKLLSVSFMKSIKPLASLAILISFFIFLYAMAGVYLFGEGNPENWENVGLAFATLTVMLTLENFPDVLDATVAVSPLAWLHLVSFMFVVVFAILNVLIGIVLNAMDEARAERDAEKLADGSQSGDDLILELDRALKAGNLSQAQIKSLKKKLKNASGD